MYYYLGFNRLVMIAVKNKDQTQGLTGIIMTAAATAHHTLARSWDASRDQGHQQGPGTPAGTRGASLKY